ncbi:Uncharacterized protein TCM_022515 [Theobroma cacao]|uniref:Uncharacterized protein n=1 Tax=Theobroma cacao TaxID=3641 RepID=A0A061EUY8_THECC|nr:Uncharacterized protein TCM_022515 [Theobroma cacao]
MDRRLVCGVRHVRGKGNVKQRFVSDTWIRRGKSTWGFVICLSFSSFGSRRVSQLLWDYVENGRPGD